MVLKNGCGEEKKKKEEKGLVAVDAEAGEQRAA